MEASASFAIHSPWARWALFSAVLGFRWANQVYTKQQACHRKEQLSGRTNMQSHLSCSGNDSWQIAKRPFFSLVQDVSTVAGVDAPASLQTSQSGSALEIQDEYYRPETKTFLMPGLPSSTPLAAKDRCVMDMGLIWMCASQHAPVLICI